MELLLDFFKQIGVGSIIGALVGIYFSYILGKKKEIEAHQREKKEDQYKKLLENAIGFWEGWDNDERKKNFMEELYTHAPLYASAEVISCANEFLSSHDSENTNSGKSDMYYSKLVLAIRKDLGVWKKDKLNEEDIKVLKLNK